MSNNTQRAQWAAKSVEVHANVSGMNDDDMETHIQDLLCNLQHLADKECLDFSEILGKATTTYKGEREREA